MNANINCDLFVSFLGPAPENHASASILCDGRKAAHQMENLASAGSCRDLTNGQLQTARDVA